MSRVAPKHGSVERRDLEQAIARGESNAALMARFGMTYRSLRQFIDGMAVGVDSPAAACHRPAAVAVCGTRSGYAAHRARRVRACDECRAAEASYRAGIRKAAA